ncbi:hypothetical protein PI124_g11026 [Phytophthora idaei]|nr:hypothetical protein PI125_g20456 [Phytophthora idaei]KAG3135338.1 hypothetical protein PI126_g18294 [Phytophthora idaei]KAG3244196.1 hypothetical protein PI124_g11026 [Phytophthora idaei]
MPEQHLICPPSDASPQRLSNFCVEPRSPFKPCRPQASHDRPQSSSGALLTHDKIIRPTAITPTKAAHQQLVNRRDS